MSVGVGMRMRGAVAQLVQDLPGLESWIPWSVRRAADQNAKSGSKNQPGGELSSPRERDVY